jgi:peptidoglycan LD-endopeptidase LytH
MRTLKVLVAGWLAGGAAIVLLSMAPPAAVAKPVVAVSRAESPALQGERGDIIVPVAGISAADLRDTFAQPRGNRTHHALDIMAPRGTPVVAAVDGTLRKLFNSGAGGLAIYQFDEAEERVYYYAHLDRYADGVAEGLVVKQGTVIGYVGTTGNAPEHVPHLHFQAMRFRRDRYWDGEPVNPKPYLVLPGARVQVSTANEQP